MNPYLCIGAIRNIQRGIPCWSCINTAICFPGLRELPSAHCRCGHAGINNFGSLRIWYSVQVWAGCLLRGFPANKIKAGGGHLDRPAGGHGAHKAALS